MGHGSHLPLWLPTLWPTNLRSGPGKRLVTCDVTWSWWHLDTMCLTVENKCDLWWLFQCVLFFYLIYIYNLKFLLVITCDNLSWVLIDQDLWWFTTPDDFLMTLVYFCAFLCFLSFVSTGSFVLSNKPLVPNDSPSTKANVGRGWVIA